MREKVEKSGASFALLRAAGAQKKAGHKLRGYRATVPLTGRKQDKICLHEKPKLFGRLPGEGYFLPTPAKICSES